MFVALLVAFTGVATTAWNIWERKKKSPGEVELTAEERKNVAAQAAKINSEERIETERWWKEQFDAVKEELRQTREKAADELEIERKWRARITKYIRRHQPWDIEMERIARENNWPISPAPRIDLTGEDDDDEEALDKNAWHQ